MSMIFFAPRCLAGGAVVYALIVMAMLLAQRRLVFPGAWARPVLARAAMPARMREVEVRTADDLGLLAWYAAPSDDTRPVFLHLHGNAGTIADRAHKTGPFAAEGYGVLMLEYRGYGGNPGRADETGLYMDGAAALAYLHRQGIPPARVILWGESLGTGIAAQMAVACAGLGTPVKAVILEAPYTTIPDVAARHYPWLPVRLLLRYRFDTAARIAFVAAPLLILHGARDKTVQVDQGRRLYNLAAAPKKIWIAPRGAHMDLFDHGGHAIIAEFLSSLPGGPANAP